MTADLISSLSEWETETEREHRVKITSTTYPPQGPLMEEPTLGESAWLCLSVCWGSVCSLVRIELGGEDDINLVIYTTAVSPGE